MSIETEIDQYAKRDWWLFDTNCLSELVKLYQSGKSGKINRFIEGQYVLIDLTNLAELYKTPYFLALLPAVFEAAAYVGAPTQHHSFIRRELFKLIGFSKNSLDPNPLGLFTLSSEFATDLPKYVPFQEAVYNSREDVKNRYQAKVEKDIGASVHPAEVYLHTQWVINQRIDSILGQGYSETLSRIPKTPETFPSLFCFDYTYYFLYCKDSRAKVHINDFNDLALTLAAPVCQRLYTERRLAYAINQVKAFTLPSERQVMDRLVRVKQSDMTKSERRRRTQSKSQLRYRLLQSTDIFTLSDLRRQLQAV